MVRTALKFALIVVVASVIAYTGLTVYGEFTQTAAAKMSDSVQLAQAQAENMNQALADVSTLTIADQQQPVAAGSAIPESFASVDGSRDVGAAGNASQTQPQPTAPVEVAAITNIDTLIAEWEPRYDGAKLAYVKFEASINNAKTSAAGYFASQQALTEQMRDPTNQARARQDDEQDLQLYQQWETQADSALAKARAIGFQLDDMDASLSKIRLRADFVFDATAFQDVPAAIGELDRELADFQMASETIRTATGSPFAK